MFDYLVTGGNGFIGSHLVRELIIRNKSVVNIDSSKYSGLKENLNDIKNNALYKYLDIDISNKKLVLKKIKILNPKFIIHCAAESHVDNSIEDPSNFITSNIIGTYNLLQASLFNFKHHMSICKFIFVSTDEVYGSLKKNEKKFNENSQYLPNSPYSASKASADHLVRAWNSTYNLPTIITHCTNNFGPNQLPEKLIPNVISRAINNKPINIYGDGKNIRDWIYVKDHVDALIKVSDIGNVGQVYNIGTNNEFNNLNIVKKICKILDKLKPKKNSYSDQIVFVKDRAGHDFRYSLDTKKINEKIKWKKKNKFSHDLETTILWYLNNKKWLNISKKINNT